MKRRISIIIISILFVYSYGQNVFDNENIRMIATENFRITVTPTQFIFCEFPITFEKTLSNKFSVGVTLSYKKDTQENGKVWSWDGLGSYYPNLNLWNKLYEAAGINASSKYYYTKCKNWYIELNFSYKHLWFDSKNAVFDNVEGYRFNGTRTERQNVFVIRPLIGYSFCINIAGKIKPIIDIYAGIGIRRDFFTFKTFNGTVYETYYEYKKETGTYTTPSFHFGIKTGISIFK
jgi:hypothetical protein